MIQDLINLVTDRGLTGGQMLTFKEAINQSDQDVRSILLGNGFSISADTIFDYAKLYDKISNQRFKSLFTGLSTYDFEKLIFELENTYSFLNIYDKRQKTLIENLSNDALALRKEFASVISKSHALYQDIFKIGQGLNQKTRSCRKFLSNFSQIYTTNYDLLLYWTIMNESDSNPRIFPTDDGFAPRDDLNPDSNLVWFSQHKKRKQKVFYLHGSLFFGETEQGLVKVKKNANLLNELVNTITNNHYLPLIVLEGSSVTKYKKICNHSYLKNAYDGLRVLSGSLFIFGHSLKPYDEHILEAIRNSSVKKNFISKFRAVGDDTGFDKRAKTLECNHYNKEVFFFDADSAEVWKT
jgi:hypothetical protein